MATQHLKSLHPKTKYQPKHRAETSSGRGAARVATVSAGAFALCLAAAAPALADVAPTPVPVLGSDPSTVTTPVTGGDPIGDLVKQVTKIAGVPDPLSSGSAKTKTPRPKAVHRHRHASAGSSSATSAPTQRKPAAPKASVAAAQSSMISPAVVPGLRRLPPAYGEVYAPTTAPAVAPPVRPHSAPISLATQAQHFVSALARDGVPATRLVAMILGTMIIGVLAGAHIRQMQTPGV